MSKVTVKKEQNFTVISNDIFKDIRLSFKAKGLLTTMLSCPPNWNYTVEGLSKISKDGKASIRSALAELEECGYLERKQQRNTKGVFTDLEYVVYEKPISDNPISENRKTDNPTSDNRTQLNTKELSTDITSTNQFNKDKLNTDNIYASFSEKKEVCAPKKQNRYISDDYSYEQLREHIRPVYSSVLKSYRYSDLDSPIEKILDITINFYRMYEKETGTKHRVLSDKAYENVVDYFMNPPDILDDYMFDTDCYMEMAEQYFQTEYNRHGNYNGMIEKSFSHFMSCSVREHLFYQTCY